MEWPSHLTHTMSGIHFFKPVPEFIVPCILSVSQNTLAYDGTDDPYSSLLFFLAFDSHLANIAALFILNPCANVLPMCF